MTQHNILVINPNSSESITKTLERTLIAPPSTNLHFFTGPSSSPPSINDEATSKQSCDACLPVLLSTVEDYDGFLVACYSEHSLVAALRDKVSGKPVVGIFEASVVHSLLRGRKFGIVTTGQAWETLLSQAVHNFLGLGSYVSERPLQSGRFAGVTSTGLGVLELHDANPDEVSQRIGLAARRLVEDAGADVICLGCAGMVGMEDAVRKGVNGKEVVVVDGVVSGVELLAGMIRTM